MNYKKYFPIYKNDENLVYLDSAATTLKPENVVLKANDYLTKYSANLHRGDYKMGIKVNHEVEETRDKIKSFIKANKREEIIFTSGTTFGINLVVFGYLKKILKKDDEVVLTKAEHASLIMPFLKLKEDIKFDIKYADLDDEKLTFETLKKVITEKTKVVCLAHVTNTFGEIRDVKKIGKYLREKGIIFLVDGAQGLTHDEVDVTDIDFYASSFHKAFGLPGAGFLYVNEKYLKDLDPICYGGGMNISYNEKGFILKEAPYKFDAGTVDILSIIAFSSAIDFINEIGVSNIKKHIEKLSNYLYEKIKEVENVKVYSKNNKTGFLLFNINNYFSQDVSVFLDKDDIATRSGHHCVKMIEDIIDEKNTVRVSLNIYNDEKDIDRFVEKLKQSDNLFKEVI